MLILLLPLDDTALSSRWFLLSSPLHQATSLILPSPKSSSMPAPQSGPGHQAGCPTTKSIVQAGSYPIAKDLSCSGSRLQATSSTSPPVPSAPSRSLYPATTAPTRLESQWSRWSLFSQTVLVRMLDSQDGRKGIVGNSGCNPMSILRHQWTVSFLSPGSASQALGQVGGPPHSRYSQWSSTSLPPCSISGTCPWISGGSKSWCSGSARFGQSTSAWSSNCPVPEGRSATGTELSSLPWYHSRSKARLSAIPTSSTHQSLHRPLRMQSTPTQESLAHLFVSYRLRTNPKSECS